MDRLIVALDVPQEEAALELVRKLRSRVTFFKVGLQLYTAAGPGIVQRIRELGADVFLDLKFFDIPNTVSHAALEGARLGARMMTLHTLGGETMMRKTAETLQEHSAREGWPAPLLLGVTILTSMDQAALESVGIEHQLDFMVLHLARLAAGAGLGGIVCSANELVTLRDTGLRDIVFVTPGIRPEKASRDDQARPATPGYAIRNGAGYLVVGRPITQAEDPLGAAGQILKEIEQAETEHA
jgi:orotidine-5'-phosphate decarboxylase